MSVQPSYVIAGDVPGPAVGELRPLWGTAAKFPVYGDLVEKLVSAHEHPNAVIAHVLATCAGYSYSDDRTVASMMSRLGLVGNRTRMVAQYVDAMLICSTAFVVQSGDGRVVILSYRGTEPANFVNWLTDVDVDPEKVAVTFASTPGAEERTYDVHGGFYRNVQATGWAVVELLRRALAGQSVLDDGPVAHPMEALYVTGHSLGAAMASLMAVALTTDPEYRPVAETLRAVYSFGQPMVGSPSFARACEGAEFGGERFLADKVIRYVYEHDVVAELPPRVSGRFAHFGREYRYHRGAWRKAGEPTRQTNLDGILLSPVTFLARQVRVLRGVPLPHSIDDHIPTHYIAKLAPPGVRSEFGG